MLLDSWQTPLICMESYKLDETTQHGSMCLVGHETLSYGLPNTLTRMEGFIPVYMSVRK